jgi:hypothetical protein
VTDHLTETRRKLTLLRDLDAVAEHRRRWEDADEDPPYSTYEIVDLDDGAEPARDWPGGLGDWYRIAASASFGHVDLWDEARVHPQSAVDALGDPIDDREWLRIGALGAEDWILMDTVSGEVIVYFNLYFKYRWASPVILRRADVPAFIDTVALGAGHRDLFGRTGDNPWWATDPWYAYLLEIGFIPGDHPVSQ